MISAEPIRGDVAKLVREWIVDEIAGDLFDVTFDGKRVVAAAGDHLVRLVPGTGRPIDHLETFADPGGLAFDGHHLWQHSEGKLQELEPRTGFVLRTISPQLDGLAGLECVRSGLLLVLHAGGRALAHVETFSPDRLDASIVANIELSSAFQGLGWIGRELWASAGRELCRIDPATGRVLARMALPGVVEACDLAGDESGRAFWCVDGRSKVVRMFTRVPGG
jgi:hypothetical protein